MSDDEPGGFSISDDWIKGLVERIWRRKGRPELSHSDSDGPTTARTYLESEGKSDSRIESSPNEVYSAVAINRSGRGTVALARDGEILWEKDLDLNRPRNLTVSNEGLLIVEDWLTTEGRKCRVVVISEAGESILKQTYSANLRSTGLSPNGSLAWVLTAGCENEDCNRLFVYDLTEEDLLLNVQPPILSVDGIKRDDSGFLVDLDGFECKYVNGEIANPKEVQWAKEEDRLDHAKSPGNAAGVAKQRLERLEELSESQIHSTIERISSFRRSGTSNARARLYRRRGELYQEIGEDRKALDDYEKALSLNEKVGVKRKARRLRKKIEGQE